MVTSGDLSTNTDLIFICILTLFVLKCNTVKQELQSQEKLGAREVLYKFSGCKEGHPLSKCFLGVNITLLKRGQMLALQAAAWGLEAFFAFQLFDAALVLLRFPAWRALPAEGML